MPWYRYNEIEKVSRWHRVLWEGDLESLIEALDAGEITDVVAIEESNHVFGYDLLTVEAAPDLDEKEQEHGLHS